MTIDITTRRPVEIDIAGAAAALAAGRVVVLIDDDADAGDLVVGAAAVSTAAVAFTVRHSSGFLEAAVDAETCRRLRLPAASENGAAQRVSVDLNGGGTGISAANRAATVAALADPHRTHHDFTRPGHVVPLLAEGGRAEAATSLAGLAGLPPVAALAGVVSPGRPTEMADRPELLAFAAEHGLPWVTVAGLRAHRLATESAVERAATVDLPTDGGPFDVLGYRGVRDDATHLALCAGDLAGPGPVPLHVHRECLSGDVLRSTACRCGAALTDAMTTVKEAGRGLVVYLRPAGPVRACGLFEVDEDIATTGAAVIGILRDLGVEQVQPLDVPDDLAALLSTAGITVGVAAPRALVG
jgi:3,4-dihydroxy 2-butanone 4-phosphate synthase/GTP cyclohydrolase II